MSSAVMERRGAFATGAAPAHPANAPGAAPTQGLFAYVREDGSQQFLPVPGPSVGEWESEHARQFEDTRKAVYTWSTPVAAALQ